MFSAIALGCSTMNYNPKSGLSLRPHGLYSPWSSPGQNTGVDSLSLLLFPTQGLNPGLPHCRWILYQLSYQGSRWIGEGVLTIQSAAGVGPSCEISVCQLLFHDH